MFSVLKAAAVSSCMIAMATFVPSISKASTLNVFENGPAPGLDIDVTLAIAGGIATFTFINNSTGAAAGSRVHEVYFESGLDSFLGAATPNATGTSAGVSLTAGASPANPPGGNNLNPDWTTAFAAFDEQNGATGITVGEQWVVTFVLDNPLTTEAQLAAAIIDQGGTSRIALHIGDCTTTSCGATVGGQLTPEQQIAETPIPGAVFLMGSVLAAGVGGMQLMRRRQNRLAA